MSLKIESRVVSQDVENSAMKTWKVPSLRTFWGAFDSAKNHKRQRRKRQSVTAKREKSQTPMFV